MRKFIRDPGIAAVIGGFSVGATVAGIGCAVLLTNTQGDARTFAWIALVLGILIGGVFLLFGLALLYEHVFDDSSKVLRLHWPLALEEKPKTQKAAPPAEESQSDPERLIQFVNAWLRPAWDKEMAVLVAVREAIGRKYGPAIQELFQDVMNESGRLAGEVDSRISGRGTEAESLMSLSTRMYRQYHVLIAKMWSCGLLVDTPHPDSRQFQEWVEIDGKMEDRVRELVALPEFSPSVLAYEVKAIEGGGASKERRRALLQFPVSGVDGGVA